MDSIQILVRYVSQGLEIAGVGVIFLGALYAIAAFLFILIKQPAHKDVYDKFRRDLGRAILLGLEFLVGADIIRTITIDPTYRTVTILAAIVLIRTFLSFSLEVEMNGRWPWQQKKNDTN